jgi:phage major head subunit gpT-like protein
MDLTSENLKILNTGFNAAFKTGIDGAKSAYKQVAMVAKSGTASNTYGWLGTFPKMREWLGPRLINSLTTHDYVVKNKPFESTISIDRDAVEDDQYGVYSPILIEMGRMAGEHPDEMVFSLLKDGFTTTCFDGQYFFDTDHPVQTDDNTVISVSNTGGGSGTPWFLLDTSRALKPMVFQERKPYQLVSKDDETDNNVFFNREFIYGVDARCNVGFGLWQLAYGSKQTLDATSYEAARKALANMVGDHGRKLNVTPTLLVVPPDLEGAARRILNSEYKSGGETNEWKGTAELLVTSWVA